MKNPEFAQHCPGCFEEKGEAAVCPHCGYDETQQRSPLVLPHRSVLSDRYLVGRVLGKPGGFGVTYLALNQTLHERVAVKEYLPRELAARDTDQTTVVAHSEEEAEQFRYGLDRFMKEARMLAQFDHAHIVGVRDFFEANGTAYLVMDYYEGKTLKQYLSEQPEGRMDPEAATKVMLRVLDGLRAVHTEDYLHRDVKPENIYLTAEGRPILIDFGAARLALGERSRSLSVVMTPGYAPYEQYRRDGDQGPHTDVYGCGATLYRMVTGTKPPPATDRIVDDTLEAPPRANPEVPETLSEAIVKALAPGNKERLSSVEDLQERLRQGGSDDRAEQEEPSERPQTTEERADRDAETAPERAEAASESVSEASSEGRGSRGGRSSPRRAERTAERSDAEKEDREWSFGRTIFVGVLAVVVLGSIGAGLALYDPGPTILRGHGDVVNSVAFSPSGSRVATGSEDGTVKVWTVETGKVVQVLRGHDGGVNSVAFSPSNNRVLSGGSDRTARLWSVPAGRSIWTLRGHERDVESVAFSPSGNQVATATSEDGSVKVWSLGTKEAVQVLHGHNDQVNTLAFSPSGSRIASGSNDWTVKVWSTETGEAVHTLRGHDGWVYSVAFSPSGELVATGSSDNTARLWSTETGKEVQVLRGHESEVISVAFSPNGSQVATGSWDETVRLWSVETGEEVRVLRGHEDAVTSLSFSPDGSLLATGSWDNTARVWTVSPDQ